MAEKTNPQKNISVQNFLFSQKNIFFAITKGKNEYKTE